MVEQGHPPAVARQNLFLSTGIFARAVEKVYAVVSENRVQRSADEWDRDNLTRETTEEDINYLLDKMRKGRILG